MGHMRFKLTRCCESVCTEVMAFSIPLAAFMHTSQFFMPFHPLALLDLVLHLANLLILNSILLWLNVPDYYGDQMSLRIFYWFLIFPSPWNAYYSLLISSELFIFKKLMRVLSSYYLNIIWLYIWLIYNLNLHFVSLLFFIVAIRLIETLDFTCLFL
jgi:hypothetical protein